MDYSFEQISELLPGLFERLINGKNYPIKGLTEGTIKNILGSRNPVPGIYLFSDTSGQTVYVGRSRNLAQRIGVDHRAKEKMQATLAYKIMNLGISNVNTMEQAREYMFKNFHAKMIPVENEYVRTIFEVYAAMKLKATYNTFVEH